jgi:hypothetical protein
MKISKGMQLRKGSVNTTQKNQNFGIEFFSENFREKTKNLQKSSEKLGRHLAKSPTSQ